MPCARSCGCRSRAACLGLVLLLLSRASAAWGPLGHRAVGAVADALLSPDARQEVTRLLRDDRDRDGSPSGRTTLADISVWADEIRGTEADRPKWHYDNMPVCGAPGPEVDGCTGGQCASGRIEPLMAQLADRSRPFRQRNEALKWIVHLVGDLHQPLHAADYAEGATRVPVELASRSNQARISLHGAWDVRLVASALRAGRSEQLSAAALRSLLRRARAVGPALREAPPSQWRAESNALASQVALDYPGFTCDGVPAQPVLLSVAYQRRARRVIFSRLALAGARLAAILNRTLAVP
jgi:hypothetical protein